MKKVILSILLFIIVLSGLTGCLSKSSKNKYDDMVNIEKIYYHEIENNRISMYIVYSISSDKEQDFYVGDPARIKNCYQKDNNNISCSIYSSIVTEYISTVDENKELIEAAGFPIKTEYKTLKASSNEKEKYIIKESIDKEFLKDKDDTYLIVGLSTRLDSANFIETTSVEKKYKFSEVETFKYNDNSEFVEEFKKDYGLN